MRFSILGETLARRDDGTGIPLGGPARRALLTLLLVRPREVVAAERLADELAPDGAVSAHALQSQVSRLRAALGPAVIERAGAGYRAAVDPEDVDAGRFERLAREGRAALAAEDPVRAVKLLRGALELWRGPALADLAHLTHLTEGDTARTVSARLEELRLGAVEDRIEAELRLGGHREAVAELRELTARHPLRERLAALLIRALSAEGGQAQALAAYEETRGRLADELGSDPSAELVALHRELLDFDPSPAQARPPAQLTSFVGRSDEVAEVAGLLRAARLVTLVGPGGVGKTRLSVEAAGAAADDVCFVELAPLREGAGLPAAVLAALGLRENGLRLDGGGQGPLERLATALADRTLLLVLDNCEHLVEEAAALAGRLLARCPRLRILATSREPLAVTGEHLWQVRPLDEAAAVRLFTERASAVRRGFTAAPEPVERICAALDRLPLAIELAAARLRTMDVEDLAQRLDDRLGMAAARGNRGAAERHRTLRAVVAWSWDLLSAPEQRAARRFTVFPAGATARAALEVCGAGGAGPEPEVLESLVDKSLLELAGGGRLRMLETVRAYGAERLREAGEASATGAAHARYVLELARTAEPRLRGPGQPEWLERLAAGHGDLEAALAWAAGEGRWETALELLAAASGYLWIRGVSGSVAARAAAVLDAVGDAPPAGLGEEFAACVLLAAAGPGGLAPWRRHRTRAGHLLATAWSREGAGGHGAVGGHPADAGTADAGTSRHGTADAAPGASGPYATTDASTGTSRTGSGGTTDGGAGGTGGTAGAGTTEGSTTAGGTASAGTRRTGAAGTAGTSGAGTSQGRPTDGGTASTGSAATNSPGGTGATGTRCLGAGGTARGSTGNAGSAAGTTDGGTARGNAGNAGGTAGTTGGSTTDGSAGSTDGTTGAGSMGSAGGTTQASTTDGGTARGSAGNAGGTAGTTEGGTTDGSADSTTGAGSAGGTTQGSTTDGGAGSAGGAGGAGRGRYPVVLLVWMLRNAVEADPLDAFALVSAQRGHPEPWVRAVAAYVSGFGPLGAGDPAAAERAFAEAAEGFRAAGDGWGTALVLDALAGMAGARGDRAGAVALTDEALALTERLGALEDSADLLVNRADQLVAGDPAAAAADYARAAALARRAGGSAALAAALRGLGDLALRDGDPARAGRLYTEALERIDPHWVKSAGSRVRALAGLGRVAESSGDHPAARARYAEAAASAASVVGGTSPEALRLLGLPEEVVAVLTAHAP
ncbi:BTAD domain-containing putative transcriptional regulator [Streptomyces sp. NPDC058157]|uniref:BTAD domain-containing putative transcriptional regulator n=1 Tax=Streptomyces sp. NPDC058157 TaxID=3346360 RepID=UPI0036F08300